MKSIISIIILFLLSTSLLSQKKWGIGLEVYSNYSDMTYTSNGTLAEGIEESYKENEYGKLCFSSQFFVSYQFNLNSSLSIGLGYHNTGQRTKETTLTTSGNIDPRKGFVSNDPNDPSIPLKSKLHYNHHNIQLPILYSFNLSKRFYLRGGLSTIFNISNTSTHYYTNQNGEKKKSIQNDQSATDFRAINLSGQFGIGIHLFKIHKINFYAQPSVERTFLALSTNAPLNRTPYSFGIVLGAKI